MGMALLTPASTISAADKAITAPLALLLGGVLIIIGLLALVATIMAAIKANEGVRFRYPFILRFIK